MPKGTKSWSSQIRNNPNFHKEFKLNYGNGRTFIPINQPQKVYKGNERDGENVDRSYGSPMQDWAQTSDDL